MDKQKMLELVKQEEEITAWAVDLQRKARKGRAQELRKMGCIGNDERKLFDLLKKAEKHGLLFDEKEMKKHEINL